ncbi:hypothetical protein M0802_005694 [Mischocyttarus mexicanus]|nr:hypothetical protein M0802_005694 [Mischocyttarus mexicanus]
MEYHYHQLLYCTQIFNHEHFEILHFNLLRAFNLISKYC